MRNSQWIEEARFASYDKLTPSNGPLALSQLWVDEDDMLAAKMVRITPTAFTDAAGANALSARRRSLLANVADRSLCLGLSERFEVVSSDQPADLTVHAVVAHIAATNPTAAGVSKVASLAPSILLPGVPVPAPRIPIGLGGLALEGEARGPHRRSESRNDLGARSERFRGLA
jgi:hypothetical protein